MRYQLPIALLLLAACEAEGPVTPPLVPSYTLPARAWAGGQLLIRSDSFSATTAMPTVRIGTVDVLVQRQGDTAFVAAVPDSMAGARPVQLIWPARSVTAGSVVVDGVVAQTTIPFTYPGISNPGTVVGIGGTARAIALSGANKEAMLIDLDAGTVSPIGARMGGSSTWEPGPTADPEVFLFPTATRNQVERWRVAPSPQRLETFSVFLPSYMPSFAEYAPGEVLAQSGSAPQWATHSPERFFVPPTVTPRAEGNDRITLSPRGDRLISNGSGLRVEDGGTTVGVGAAVVGLPQRQVMFRIPGLRESLYQAFSRDGSELALLGAQDGVGRVLVVVDATDGAVRHTRLMADSLGWAVAYDPVRPLVYLLVAPSGARNRAALLVLDRVGWRQVGRIAIDCSTKCSEAVIVPSSQNAVYVMGRGDFTAIHSVRVSLPPQ